MSAALTTPQTVTVHVPIKFGLRRGRKTVISEFSPPIARSRTDSALLKALARAHRWRQQIENGEYSSITELARSERVNESYACRLLRLTLLAPSIVTNILNGRQSSDMTLNRLMKALPVGWQEQITVLCRDG